MQTRAREIRKKLRLTLDDVAARMDPPTTIQTIGRLEKGERQMTLDWLYKFAKALDCTVNDLLGLGSIEVPNRGTLEPTGYLTPAAQEMIHLQISGRNPQAFTVECALSDLLPGDTVICDEVTDYADSLGRDCLVTTTDGQTVYGKLLAGSKPDHYTIISSSDVAQVLYDVTVKSVAKRTMLIRTF